MKKLTAILLLLLLLFNLIGYRWFFAFTIRQWDGQITAALDKERYNEQDLITIKVPLSLPYQTDRSDFERVDGEISIDGQWYKYVKRKVVNGELVLLCLPDRKKAKLQTAKDNFFKLTNLLQTATSAKKPVHNQLLSFNDIAQDYDNVLPQWLLPVFYRSSKRVYHHDVYQLISRSLNNPEQPPDIHKA